ncbi:MAG: biosynthetic-type acetolactate synthase large subunit [Spirochaetia bacterium]
MSPEKIIGARSIVDTLEKLGVTTIFGYPGGATLPIYEALADSSIRHVLSRHEQGAAHMADGYARVSGKVGVCIATSGPGATNLVTGIANAYMDSTPLVAITGQVPRTMIGNDAFQEVDTTGITIPITKHNYLVQEVRDLPGIIEEAFYLASTGRKGPVLIDIPKDVQTELFVPDPPKGVSLEGYKPTTKGHSGQIKRAVGMISRAERPCILAGGGIVHADAEDKLLEFAEMHQIPVTWTLMGKNAFPNAHPLNLGMVGYHGTIPANTAVSESDLIIALGTRFGDRSTGPLETYAPNARIIHIDIDPAEISKNVPSALPIVGDARNILETLCRVTEPAGHGSWLERVRGLHERHPIKVPPGGLSVPGIITEVRARLSDPVLVTDVGRHQIFAAHHFPVNTPKSFVTSGGLGTMGFGLPAALGAKLGAPDRRIVCISGDGSFLMTLQELITSAEEEISVIVLVMNDSCLGMIKQLQDAFYGGKHRSCSLGGCVDFAGIAERMGVRGYRVEKKEQLAAALEAAQASEGTTVIDCVIDNPVNVYPMVTGSSLTDCIEED